MLKMHRHWSDEELHDRLVAEAHRSFDLENGPMRCCESVVIPEIRHRQHSDGTHPLAFHGSHRH